MLREHTLTVTGSTTALNISVEQETDRVKLHGDSPLHSNACSLSFLEPERFSFHIAHVG